MPKSNPSIDPKITKKAKSAFLAKRRCKPELTVQLANGEKVELFGVKGKRKRYVLVVIGGLECLTPYEDWHGNGNDATNKLRQAGVTIVGSMQEIKAAVAQLKQWRPARVADAPGWTPRGFAQPNGEVLIEPGDRQQLRAFVPDREMLERRGSLESWQKQVAEPLADHKVASFFMMVIFAPALLRLTDRTDNFGFELAGPAGRGKSTMQLLMASAAGPAIGSDGATYWRTCNSTMNALESTMSLFNDMPLILDEAGLVQGSGGADDRAREMRDMAFRLAQGRVKHRFGEQAGRTYRLVYVLSTNRPIASLLSSAHAAEAEAIADRLMTIPLTIERQFGIFDRLPKGVASTSAFADALKRGAAENYGHALTAYLQYLVRCRHGNAKGLRRWIARRVGRFVKAADANGGDGSQRRVADAFGLVYVAGLLAKRARVLPKSYRCMAAALSCFELHRNHGRVALAFDDRLRALIRRSDTIDLDVTDVAKLSAKELATCRAFLYTGRSGERELLVRQCDRARAFPDWNKIRHGSEVERRLKTSKDRNVVPRRIVPGGKPEDVYCFDIFSLEN